MGSQSGRTTPNGEYGSEFSKGQQNTDWLSQKSVACKSKFEMDQHNREAKLEKRCATWEDEHKEAAKNRRRVAESLTDLVASLKQFTTTLAS